MDASPNWILTNIQTQTALRSPVTQLIWSPHWERVPGSVSYPSVRPQRFQFGVTRYNPKTQTDIVISLWANCTSDFMLMLLVLSCKTWKVLKAGACWPDHLPGLNNLKIPSPSHLRCCKSCTHSRQSFTLRSVSRQVRSKVRGLLCFVLEALTSLSNFSNIPSVPLAFMFCWLALTA